MVPVLLLLVFGIIEFSLIFSDYVAVSSSVRVGARIASAEPRNAAFATDAAAQVAKEGSALNFDANTVLWVYRAGTNGYPIGKTDFSSCPTSCLSFTWNAATKSFGTTPTGSWSATTQNACQGDSGHDSVGLYLSVKDQALTKFFWDSMTLKSRTVMSFEPIPVSETCKP